jgi:hypothetical protein
MLPTPSNLDGLIALSRQSGIDVRPTLVRVLTDLYVQKRDHTAEEYSRYGELAGRLLESVDEQTRAAVARKLSACPDAPHAIVLQLACDVFDVAEPILRLSPCLSEYDLLAVASGIGGRHAEAVAAREGRAASDPEQPAAVADRTEEETEPVVVETVEPVEHAAHVQIEVEADEPMPPAPDVTAAVGATPSPQPGISGASDSAERSIGERFLAAGPDERLALIAQIEIRRADGKASQPAPAEDAIRALDDAVLDSRAAVADHLMRAFNLSSDVTARILDDAHGEPLMIALKALGAPREVLVRALLLVNPEVGQSVERVFSLAALYDEIGGVAASQIVASLSEPAAGKRRTGRHQPHLFDDETRGRRGTADAARRPLPQSGESRTADPQRRQRTI